MKNIIIITSFLALFIFASCSEKETPDNNTTSTNKSVNEIIAGSNSRQWGLTKLYINDTLYPLTSEQLLYTKTYKRDSTFADTDGLQGTYNFNSNGKYLSETFTTGGSGNAIYSIISLTDKTLEYKLIYNGTDSLNTRFIFNAK